MGGKDLRAEAERVQSLNIVVGTPGRLLQHIDESPMWDSSHLLILGMKLTRPLADEGICRRNRPRPSQACKLRHD